MFQMRFGDRFGFVLEAVGRAISYFGPLADQGEVRQLTKTRRFIYTPKASCQLVYGGGGASPPLGIYLKSCFCCFPSL